MSCNRFALVEEFLGKTGSKTFFVTITSIKTQLATIPKQSGVYQFLDSKDQILYVGKAKNLHKRISSYTKQNQLSNRIARMVFLANKVETTQTENEVEALLLEHNLIKKLSPRFNILLRDDKTFPQILITNHDFPQITKCRGSKKYGDVENSGFFEKFLGKTVCEKANVSDIRALEQTGLTKKLPKKMDLRHQHFGPFASAHDVNRTIDILRKVFLLRSCTDDEFRSRKKPCLEFQIKRCSAPCVGMISQSDYKTSVDHTVEFLKGKSAELQKNLNDKMLRLSAAQDYEKAAFIRDQIKSLNLIQTKQNINVDVIDDADVITVIASNGTVCAYVGFFRGGQSLGSKPYFYEIDEGKKLEEFLAEFLGQFYLAQTPPRLVLLNLGLEDKNLMSDFLEKISGKKSEILTPKRGARLSLVKDQEHLARQNLDQKLLQNLNNKALLLEVKKLFDLAKIPQRIEVYDNSHTSGTNAVGALITAGPDGFIKNGYRKFNLRFDISQNRDDTAMMREVLTRRFSKLEKAEYPDLIIIDGGKGQLSAAQKVFEELQIKIPLVCMSKGEDRNAGEEWFHQPNKESFTLPKHHPAMHYLQRLRDEAHRFAITTHRKKRAKAAFE